MFSVSNQAIIALFFCFVFFIGFFFYDLVKYQYQKSHSPLLTPIAADTLYSRNGAIEKHFECTVRVEKCYIRTRPFTIYSQ